jgi:hypothetical protein
MMNAAADPTLYSQLDPAQRPAFNAALNGAGARLLDLWTLGVVVPRLKPDTVVIGMSSRELNDGGSASARAFRSVRRSPGGRAIRSDLSPTERIQWLGERASYLVRYRSRLRAPSTLKETPDAQRRAAVGPLGGLTAIRLFDDATYTVTDRFRNQVIPQAFGGFAIGGVEASALGHLVGELVRAGIEVVLVEMPITDDIIPAHPRGAEDYRRFEQVLGLVSRSARVVDGDAWFEGTGEFADPLHLNGAGRERFTRQLFAAAAAPS